jgi:hypothetical protein
MKRQSRRSKADVGYSGVQTRMTMCAAGPGYTIELALRHATGGREEGVPEGGNFPRAVLTERWSPSVHRGQT